MNNPDGWDDGNPASLASFNPMQASDAEDRMDVKERTEMEMLAKRMEMESEEWGGTADWVMGNEWEMDEQSTGCRGLEVEERTGWMIEQKKWGEATR